MEDLNFKTIDPRVYITIKHKDGFTVQNRMAWTLKGDMKDLKNFQSELARIHQFAVEEVNKTKHPFKDFKIIVEQRK